MNRYRVDEYHKYNCHFSGLLLVVDYSEDMHNDFAWGTYNPNLTFDYIEKARQYVKDKGYDVVEELLTIPEYVVRIK